MKKIKLKNVLPTLAAAASLSVISLTYAHAEVTLKVDEHIKVTAINGNEIRQSPFQALKTEFKLQPGKHVITAKYDRLYELRGDNHDYLRSGNVTVSANLQDNQTYKLAMLGQPEEYEEAVEYAKKPTLAIMQGSSTLAKVQGDSTNSGIFAGLAGIFGGGDSALSSNQKTIASINSEPAQNQAQYSSAPVVNNNNTSTLDKFMSLWLQASPDEREKIRMWVDK